MGSFSNIRYDTKKHKKIEKCVGEIVKHLSKINDYNIDDYIQTILIPLLDGNSRTITDYKEYKKYKDFLKEIKVDIEKKHWELQNKKYEMKILESQIEGFKKATKSFNCCPDCRLKIDELIQKSFRILNKGDNESE